jgi:peptidoglycan/xylan/chitin deacetylase (PgdA/CDA1 family)
LSVLILCYHKVGPVSEEGRRLNVSPERLQEQVQFWTRRRQWVLPQHLLGQWPASGVCFTFDDAYTSALRNACPVLERQAVRGAFYAVTEKVGKSSDWDQELARPLATWNQLRQAMQAGHEIGNHTANHSRLAELESPVSEIDSAQEELIRQGLNPTSFCFPYGSLHPDALERVGQLQMIGLSLTKGLAIQSHDKRALPRIVVGFGDTLPLLLYKAFVRPWLPGANQRGIILPRSGS